MKVLIVGHLGQLGTDLKKEFACEELILKDQDELLVQNEAQVQAVVQSSRPDLILNCAAFHRVDDCEDHVQLAFDVNVFGVRNLALAAKSVGADLVHFSTDYVFDSAKRTPYVETDPVCPRCIYGVSKAAGELMLASTWERHYICRVSGLYGYAGSREKGTNFVEMMLQLAKQKRTIQVVVDQILTPTSTQDVASKVRELVGTGRYGLYHLTNAGQCSWFEFAAAIFDYAGLKPELIPVTSDAFPTKAKRPNYSVLDNARLREVGLKDMPEWRDALKRYLDGRSAAGRT